MSIFRTIEVSDPAYMPEGMHFVTVKSPALRRRGNVTVWLPKAAEASADLPLVTLLHGVFGSHWGWAFKGNAHGVAARLVATGEIVPMALAMPSDGLWGDGSAYVAHDDADYERWIVDEVPAIAREVLSNVTDRSAQAIVGLSMGGYGALRLGSKYADRYVAIAGHSSVTRLSDIVNFVEEPIAAFPQPADADVIDAMLAAGRLPAIRFDCGREDGLIEGNRLLHRQLEEASIAHEYEEFSGGHTWDYWQTHLADSLRFISANLS